MATELQTQQQRDETLTTWKRLYEAAWEQGFNTFMLILAQQYKIELMIQIGNQKQPSPVIEFWREGLKGLSPRQMIEGLRGWQGTEQRGFQPTPEDIQENGRTVEATDKPRRKINPDCQNCGGTGWKANDGRKYRELTVASKAVMMRCDCSRVVYGDKVYKDLPALPPATPDEENRQAAEAFDRLSKKLPGVKNLGKPMPETKNQLSDEALARRRDQMKADLDRHQEKAGK